MGETISFWASKLIWALLAPANLLVLFLLLSFLVGVPMWLRLLMRGFSVFMMSLALLFPLGEWAILPLETCLAERNPPMQVDGVIVLGGALDAEISEKRKSPSFTNAAERLTALMYLIKNHPQAQFIYTGGSGSLVYRDFREADYAKRFLTDLGVNVERVIFETESRNTYENMLKTKDVFSKIKGQNWLLVTSASHMPRAYATFDMAADDSNTHFFPHMVDFKTAGAFRFHINPDLAQNLALLNIAAKEYLGLAYAHLRGQTKHFLPCSASKGVTLL